MEDSIRSTDSTPDPGLTTGNDAAGPGGYRALRENAALLTHEERAVIEIRGNDAREHFGGLLTNHVEALSEGEGAYTFMLTSKGRPVAEMRILAVEIGDEEVLWADVPATCIEGCVEHLGRFLPPRLASYERIGGMRRIGVVGPRAPEALQHAGLPAPPAESLAHRPLDAGAVVGGRRVVRREEIEGPGFDIYVPGGGGSGARNALAAGVEAAGGGVAGGGAWNAWRVERGLPVYGREIDLDVLPQETGQQDRAVDFEKGCYTGQEVVARIHYRGKVNRHLRGLRFADEPREGPEAGTGLYGDDRSRGRITSVARSPRLGAIGLGYVRREVEPGTALGVGTDDGPPAEVVDLPFPGA